MIDPLRWLLAGVLGYLIGSLPFALWVGRIAGRKDIREGGSGHAGATNVMRQAGWLAGAATLLLDVGKGMLAMQVARWLGEPAAIPLAAGLAVAGHCWPALAGFRGGMGMATAAGAVLATNPLAFAIALGLGAACNLGLRHTARANLLTGLIVGPLLIVFGIPSLAAQTAIAVGAVVALRGLSDWDRTYRELWLDRETSTPSGG
jgi:glycerol-3-phosphate acyltransferase PlsY